MLRVPALSARVVLRNTPLATRALRSTACLMPRRLASNTTSSTSTTSRTDTKASDSIESKSASATPSEKDGVRDTKTSFTTKPAPKASRKKTHKIRNTSMLALLAGAGFIGAAVYSQEDLEFGQQFEHYVPGARRFMDLVRFHDDSIVMALSDVGFKVYEELVYTGRFIYGQFFNLINMLRYNNWEGDGDSESESEPGRKRDVASAPETSKSIEPAKPKSFPAPSMKTVQVAVEIPPIVSENQHITSLSKTLSEVVNAFNKRGLSPDNVQQLKALNDSLIALDKHMNGLKEEEKKAIEAALAKEKKAFESSMTDFKNATRIALASREAQLIESHTAKLKEHDTIAEKRLMTELESQRDLLERRFNRFVRARVDEERGGRLANLERVEAQLRQLTQMAQESGELMRQTREMSKFSIAINALKNTIDSSVRTPFASELSVASGAATSDFPATQAALSSISRDISEDGIPSQVELEERFEVVRKEIRSVSLVPENGNFGSQVLSATLSKVMFEKEGLVEGDDVESILSRTSYFLREHQLDHATRELNQLHGWPKKLAQDWISDARRRLEVEQAIRIAQCEETLAKLTFV